VPLYKKLIGLFVSKVNKFDILKLERFAVVPFIEFDVIEPELLIDDDVILLVCKLPLDSILFAIVRLPETTKLFVVAIFVPLICVYII